MKKVYWPFMLYGFLLLCMLDGYACIVADINEIFLPWPAYWIRWGVKFLWFFGAVWLGRSYLKRTIKEAEIPQAPAPPEPAPLPFCREAPDHACYRVHGRNVVVRLLGPGDSSISCRVKVLMSLDRDFPEDKVMPNLPRVLLDNLVTGAHAKTEGLEFLATAVESIGSELSDYGFANPVDTAIRTSITADLDEAAATIRNLHRRTRPKRHGEPT